MIFLRLFWEFFKTGLFSIGGGLATLPFLYEMQEKTGWFTVKDLSNFIAVSESTPGPMGINMATYTGFVTAGPIGSVIAVCGLVLPSIVIIIMISKILDRFKNNKYVDRLMYGLKAASVALIFCAGVSVANTAFIIEGIPFSIDIFNWPAIIFGIVLFAVYKLTNKHPIFYIIAAGIVGVLLKL